MCGGLWTMYARNWNGKYHCGHYDAKGRVAGLILQEFKCVEFILMQRKFHSMKTSCLTSGPYMEMLWEGWFAPQRISDGTFVFAKLRGKYKHLDVNSLLCDLMHNNFC